MSSPTGPILRLLLRLRLDPDASAQLLSELAELHAIRAARDGERAAARWLARERRRLAAGLLTGRISAGTHPSPQPSPHGVGSEAMAPGRSVADRLHDGVSATRRSVRSLARTPALALAIVLTAGLGIGGTTVVWAVVHAVLVSPLPYPEADRIVLLRTARGSDRWGTSMADVEAVLADRPAAFDGVAAYTRGSPTVLLGDQPRLLDAKWVTDTYFPMLGAQPVLGRGFTADESRAGAPDVVMLSTRLWDQAFERSPDVIGRSVVVDGRPHEIVGVLPAELGPLDQADLYPALRVETPPRKGPFFFTTVARLRPGARPEDARAQLAEVSERMFPEWQASFPTADAVLDFDELKPAVVGDVSGMLLLVLGATSFLLLAAAVNAAGLLVARGMERRRELGVRIAVGASRRRIVGLVLTEAALLAVASGALGLVLGLGGVDLLHRFGAGRLPRMDEVAVTTPVLLVLAALTLASWALLGAIATASLAAGRAGGTRVPGRRSSRAESPVAGLTRGSPSLAARRMRRALVAVQFAVAIPLLVGAGLLGRSMHAMESQGPGFDLAGLASMTVALPEENYPDGVAVRGFWAELLPRIEALPGVRFAGLADARPPVIHGGSNNFVIEGEPTGSEAPQTQSTWITASPGFFETLGLRVIEGRLFGTTVDTMRHAVVDQAWADRYARDRSAVGLRFRSGGCTIEGCPWVEVIGVVATVKTTGLDDTGAGTIYYDFARDSYGYISLHLRSDGDPLAAVPGVRALIRDRDPSVPIDDIRTAEALSDESMIGRRVTGGLVALLALIALGLSAVGIYGAMATLVRQRRRETSIRLALGAAPSRALREVVVDGVKVALVGIAVGVGVAMLLGRTLEGMLFGIAPLDPAVYLTVGLGALAVAAVATTVPARHAATTDPAGTLRSD